MLEDGLSIMLRIKKEPCIQQQNKDIYIYIYVYIIYIYIYSQALWIMIINEEQKDSVPVL